MRNIIKLLTFVLMVSCNTADQSSVDGDEEAVKDDSFDGTSKESVKIDWESIEVQNLPYKFEYGVDVINQLNGLENFYRYKKMEFIHQEVNSIFKKFTVINIFKRPYTEIVAPNTNLGNFYKRFPDVNGFKIVLFCYLRQSAECQAYPTFEIQIFDKGNICVDRLIVADGARGEDCDWIRNFTYNMDNLIIIKDVKYCIDYENNDTIDYEKNSYKYKIKSNGKIVEYFEIENGELSISTGKMYPIYKDTTDEDGLMVKKVVKEKELFCKGSIKNHFKEGLWLEYNNVYEPLYRENEIIPFAKGNYKAGEKDGEWIFYQDNYRYPEDFLEDETFIYENGQVK